MSVFELEGRKQRIKHQNMDIAISISAKIKSVKRILMTSAIDSIEEIDIESAHSLLKTALEEKRQYIENLKKIKAIDEELN